MDKVVRRKVFRFIAVLVVMLCAVSACSVSSTFRKVDDETSLAALTEEAYIFTYSMLQNYKTLHRMVVAGDRDFNELRHRRKLLTADFTTIVGPNNDTLYSAAWLDLRDGPVEIDVPPVDGNRYYSLQFIDMYLNNFAYVGNRATGSEGGTYTLVRGVSRGDKPPPNQFESESDFVFLIIRILANDEEDALEVNRLQDQFKLRAWKKEGGKKPGMDGFPAYSTEKILSPEFISLANFLLQFVDIHPNEREKIERFSSLGIGKGRPQSIPDFDEDERRQVESGIASARERIARETLRIGRVVDEWSTTYKGFGSRAQLGENYLSKAAAARIGLYGNSPEENISYVRQTLNGKTLDASDKKYRIKFSPGELPPVKGFWSMTLYRMPDVLFFENALQRYSLGDRSALRYDRDGGLTLYIQHDMPSPDKMGNWLPAPAGPFSLALRMYIPGNEIVDGDWLPPSLLEADAGQ